MFRNCIKFFNTGLLLVFSNNFKYNFFLIVKSKMKKFIPGKTRVLYGGVAFGKKERRAIDAILDKNWWGLATEGKLLEEELAKVQGVKRAVLANSGTSALDLGIRALGLPKGSEVIVPACSFPTPIASFINCGLKPVVADIELGNYFLSPKSVEKSISGNTSAIFIVYAAGLVGKLDEILKIARKNKLKIIEDNCDGFGGTWDGKMLGSFGEFSAISTHAAHIISTGEGGAVLTDNPDLADRVLSIRDWGRILDFENRKKGLGDFPADYRRYIYSELGSNLKPLELQAAMGRVQLKRLQEFKKARKKHAETLIKLLSKYEDRIVLPVADPRADVCWYTFPITLKGIPRRKVLKALDDGNIEWRPILAGNIARQPAFLGYVSVRDKLNNADQLLNSSFWVSVHPTLSVDVMKYVANTIIGAIN